MYFAGKIHEKLNLKLYLNENSGEVTADELKPVDFLVIDEELVYFYDK
jgi:hypothetical protein